MPRTTLTDVEDAGHVARCLRAGQPDWEAIDFDLPCARCGYDLRRLPEPRCPECGLACAWADVLDSRLHWSRFLFEHHWRKRPVGSWLRTAAAGLRPWRFWRQVSIHEHVRAGPLVVVFLLSALISIVAVQGTAAGLWLAAVGLTSIVWQGGFAYFDPGELLAELQAFWAALAWPPISIPEAYLVVLALLALYGLAAATLLCGLRETLGRCRVRTVQVFRVLAYSATPVCLVWGACLLLLPALAILLEQLGLPVAMTVSLVTAVWVLPHVIFTIYVGCGLRHYLRLPRAWLLAATASIVGQLFALTVVLAVPRAFGWMA